MGRSGVCGSCDSCGEIARAVQSVGARSPVSIRSGGLQSLVTWSAARTRRRISQLSREARGGSGQGTSTESSEVTQSVRVVPSGRVASIWYECCAQPAGAVVFQEIRGAGSPMPNGSRWCSAVGAATVGMRSWLIPSPPLRSGP